MPDRFYFLDQLSSAEALQLLAETSERFSGKPFEAISFIFPETVFGTLVTLVVPQVAGGPEENEAVFEHLVREFRRLKAVAPSQRPTGGERLSLREGITRLLVTGSGAMSGDVAPIKEGEFLLIAPGMKPKRAEQLFKNLNLHATALSVSASKERFLFHVRDDQRRFSSFQSLLAGGSMDDCLVLCAFQCGDRVVFLPRDIRPDARDLGYFCRFIKAAPNLFGIRAMKEGTERFVAVTRSGGEKTTELEFLNLTGLKFFKDFLMVPRKDKGVRFRHLNLRADQERIRQLWLEIRKAAPSIGYRLELRPTRYMDSSELDRLRLERQRAEIACKLAYLESTTRARPILLRFTQKQLPALADVLRAFPMRIIQDGRLQYAFQASEREPAGLHFLLIDPNKALMEELDPLFLWDELDNRPMRFRLDPFWARHYHGPAVRSLVFVPEGTALFPPMHDWKPADMDDYLRQVMEQWFRGRVGAGEIPEKPIYLFDGELDPEAELNISVLDRKGFQPLRMRLGWINDNLTVSHALGIERFIEEMAGNLNRQRLADALGRDADIVMDAFREEAVKVSTDMAGTINLMTRSLTDELERMVESTHEMAGRVRNLGRELREWEKVEEGMMDLKEEIHERKAVVSEKSASTRNEFEKIETRIKRQLAASARKRKAIEEKIEDEVSALRGARAYIKKHLLDLRLWD